MITRRKYYTKKAPSRDSHKIYIICEGTGTEPDYFSFFEGLSSNLQIITIPPGKGTDPIKLMELAQTLFLGDDRNYTVDYLQNDRVWFIIDTDSWGKEGKIKPLREFCSNQNSDITKQFNEVKPYSAWNVAQSNPSFEIWLYYHFYKDKPIDSDVEQYTTFKEFINNLISGGYNYTLDQVRLPDAIKNAENNYSMEDDSHYPDLYSTEVYLLGKEIYPFIKNELDKLKNKL